MTHIPTPRRTQNQRVAGEFYPLQKEELMALRKAKLINNTAYVHLALRFENPWCDRPVEVIPKEFALRWNIPESSVYKAIAKLKELGLIKIKSGKLVIEWIVKSDSELSAPAKDSQLRQKILRSDNEFSAPAKNSQLRQNQSLKSLKNGASDSPQTIQTLQTNQTGAGEQVKSHLPQQRRSLKAKVKSEVEASVKSQDSSSSTNELSSLSDVLEGATSLKSDKSSAPVTQNTTKDSTPWDIPQDLRNKLEELEIPLDARVLKAIASHHNSQAYGAVAHIENTRETINNPRGVFLFQISRQPIESLGSRGRVMTARDFDGYTVEHLKKMYPNNWREAAVHFGVPLDD